MKAEGEAKLVEHAIDGPATVPPPSVLSRSVPVRGTNHRDVLRRRLLATADVATVLISTFAVAASASSIAPFFWSTLLLPLWVVLAKVSGLYDRDHRGLRHLTVDELPSLVSWATTGTAAFWLLVSLTPAGAPSSSLAIRQWLLLVIIAPMMRGAARGAVRLLTPPERVVLLGSGRLERAARRKIELFADMHVTVIGHIDEDEVRSAGPAHLDAVLERSTGGVRPERLILAAQEVNEPLIADLTRYCKLRKFKLSVVPPARGMFGTAVRLTHVADLPLIEYHTWDPSRSTMLLKRAMDVVVAAVALLCLLPLFAVVAAAVRLESRGPVLFRQVRGGMGGRPFRICKFRTMSLDAEERLGELVAIDDLADPMFKLRGDPRITRVGRWLRRWSIDELPQLVNVLRGDMSLVGPRPEQLELIARYRPEHRIRLQAKPGMTGPMQVFGRGELGFDERLAVEREYLENVSIGRDIRILLMTVPAIISGKGAF